TRLGLQRRPPVRRTGAVRDRPPGDTARRGHCGRVARDVVVLCGSGRARVRVPRQQQGSAHVAAPRYRTYVVAFVVNCVADAELPAKYSTLMVDASVICTRSSPVGGKLGSNGLYSLYDTISFATVTSSGR